MTYQRDEVRRAINTALANARERAVRDAESFEPLYRKVGGEDYEAVGSQTVSEEVNRLTEQYLVDLLADDIITAVDNEHWVSSSYGC